MSFIPTGLFSGCSGFQNILTIPDFIHSIHEESFKSCNGFTQLILGNSIETISAHAFSECQGFDGILTIPFSVRVIGDYSFSNCAKIKELNISGNLDSVGKSSFSGCNDLSSLYYYGSLSPNYQGNPFESTGLTLAYVTSIYETHVFCSLNIQYIYEETPTNIHPEESVFLNLESPTLLPEEIITTKQVITSGSSSLLIYTSNELPSTPETTLPPEAKPPPERENEEIKITKNELSDNSAININDIVISKGPVDSQKDYLLQFEEIEDTIEFAIELDSDFISFYTATPLPGTKFYEYAKENNLINSDTSFKSAYYYPSVGTHYLSKERVFELHKKAIRRFYLRPGYILRTLLRIRSITEFKNYFKAGLGILFKR